MKKLHGILFVKIYGLAIYNYMVKECNMYGCVKQEKIFSEHLIIENSETNKRHFRYYREWLEELYKADVIEHCFDDNKNGIKGMVISNGHLLAKRLEKEAKKQLKRSSELRRAADDRYQGKVIFDDKSNDTR